MLVPVVVHRVLGAELAHDGVRSLPQVGVQADNAGGPAHHPLEYGKRCAKALMQAAAELLQDRLDLVQDQEPGGLRRREHLDSVEQFDLYYKAHGARGAYFVRTLVVRDKVGE